MVIKQAFYLGECENKAEVLDAISKWVYEDILNENIQLRGWWDKNVFYEDTIGKVEIGDILVDPFGGLISDEEPIIVFGNSVVDVITIGELGETYELEDGTEISYETITPLKGIDVFRK